MLRKKLKSNRGMSILAALLLFLVCAVIGSVVLTAGTAAAGRLSKLTERDSRYYSVASASELLAKELSGKEVTIVRTSRHIRTTTTLRNSDGSPKEQTGNPAYDEQTVYNTSVSGSAADFSTEGMEIDTDSMSLLAQMAVKLMFGKNGAGRCICNTEEAFGCSFSNGNAHEGEFKLKHGGDDYSFLEVECAYSVEADGTVSIVVKSGDYSQTIVLKPVISERSATERETAPPTITEVSSGGYKEEIRVETTVTKTSVISWTVWRIG